MNFLNRIQRLTTCASLYGYCPSVGLDDCLLPLAVRMTAREIMRTNVDQYKSKIGTQATMSVPYHINNETSPDAGVDRLVQLRTQSEMFITKHILGRKSKATGGLKTSACSPEQLNQIALLAMLATKGSVSWDFLDTKRSQHASNLIQCSHSLGRFCVCRCVTQHCK